jgi:hypothetical protein
MISNNGSVKKYRSQRICGVGYRVLRYLLTASMSANSSIATSVIAIPRISLETAALPLNDFCKTRS